MPSTVPVFRIGTRGLFKKFAIDERNVFEFRAEAYDVFNHPNWASPNFTAGTSTFGKVTSKTDLSRRAPALTSLLVLKRQKTVGTPSPVFLCDLLARSRVTVFCLHTSCFRGP